MICQRCTKNVSGDGIHTCTPSDLVRELQDTIAQQAELLAAHKAEMQDWQRELLAARQERNELLDLLSRFGVYAPSEAQDEINAAIAKVKP